MQRLRNWLTSWRLSRVLARDPEWRGQIAESDAKWDNFVERGCPIEELASLDDIRAARPSEDWP